MQKAVGIDDVSQQILTDIKLYFLHHDGVDVSKSAIIKRGLELLWASIAKKNPDEAEKIRAGLKNLTIPTSLWFATTGLGPAKDPKALI